MLTMLGRRLVLMVPLLLVVSFAVFCLQILIPGDAGIALAGGDNATPERIATVRDQLGLDDPFVVQYGRWLGGAVQGDLGTSLETGESVTALVKRRLPVTLAVAGSALLFAVIVSSIAGIVSGLRPGGWVDRIALLGSSLGIAIPGFWLAMIFISAFAVERRWFPALGYSSFSDGPVEWARHLVLPAVALGSLAAASQTRQIRGALLDVLDTNYVRTGWAKGGSPRWVVGKHALKNAAIPAVTVLGLQTSSLLGGTVIVEQIFAIPGMGTALIRAIQSQDLPVVQGFVVFFVVINTTINLLVDLTYGYLDPRVQVS